MGKQRERRAEGHAACRRSASALLRRRGGRREEGLCSRFRRRPGFPRRLNPRRPGADVVRRPLGTPLAKGAEKEGLKSVSSCTGAQTQKDEWWQWQTHQRSVRRGGGRASSSKRTAHSGSISPLRLRRGGDCCWARRGPRSGCSLRGAERGTGGVARSPGGALRRAVLRLRRRRPGAVFAVLQRPALRERRRGAAAGRARAAALQRIGRRAVTVPPRGRGALRGLTPVRPGGPAGDAVARRVLPHGARRVPAQ